MPLAVNSALLLIALLKAAACSFLSSSVLPAVIDAVTETPSIVVFKVDELAPTGIRIPEEEPVPEVTVAVLCPKFTAALITPSFNEFAISAPCRQAISPLCVASTSKL